MVFYTEIESCTEEMAVVAGGVFGVMGLIVACLVAVLLTQVCKRYDSSKVSTKGGVYIEDNSNACTVER